MAFFDGPVSDAVREATAKSRALVVLLDDRSDTAAQVAQWLQGSTIQEHLQSMDALLLRLPDSLSTDADDATRDARMFRQLFPCAELPTLVLVGLHAKVLATVSRFEDEEELITTIAAARKAFDTQRLSAHLLVAMLNSQGQLAPQAAGQPTSTTPNAPATATASAATAPQLPAAPPALVAGSSSTITTARTSTAAAPAAAVPVRTVAANTAATPSHAGPQQRPSVVPATASPAITPQPAASSDNGGGRLPSSVATGPVATSAAVQPSPAVSVAAAAPAALRSGGAGAPLLQNPSPHAQANAAALPRAASPGKRPFGEAAMAPSKKSKAPASGAARNVAGAAKPSASQITHAAADASSDPQQGQVASAALPASTLLQFKLTNGETMRQDFASNSTLAAVRSWLDCHRTDGGAPYTLLVPYPKRLLGPEHLTATLLDLDLVPRCALVLEPVGGPVRAPWGPLAAQRWAGAKPLSHSKGPAAQGPGNGTPATWLHWLVAQLAALWAFVLSFLPIAQPSVGPASTRDHQDAEDPRATGSTGGDTATGRWTDQSTGAGNGLTMRQRGASTRPAKRVMGLSDIRTDDQEDLDKRGNAFWNGNSTQFGADGKQDD